MVIAAHGVSKKAQDCTSAGVSSRRTSDARTGQAEDWHLASHMQPSKWHQVDVHVYYYKRVTFYEMIKKSHTYLL